MVTAFGQRFKIISFVSFTSPMSEAYVWRGMLVNLQPSGFMLRTKQDLALICFSHLHMFGRTHSFQHLLESSRSFSFSYPEPFICDEVYANFSRSVVSASWWLKQPTALDWFTCGTTHPFIFPDKLPIFLSLVSRTCPLFLQSL